MNANIKIECARRWATGAFVESGLELPSASFDLPWVAYEDYMRAQLVEAVPGELGRIIVDFPPEAVEDNHLHSHPLSDRVITVIRGHGWFVAVRHGVIERHELFPGFRVWMPRGKLHTFLAGPEGLLVESRHNPWVPLEDPKTLIYPQGANAERWTLG